MLALTRRVDETIVMLLPDGRSITVKVASVNGERARLAIEAPLDIAVHRLEVLERIVLERIEAERAVASGRSGQIEKAKVPA